MVCGKFFFLYRFVHCGGVQLVRFKIEMTNGWWIGDDFFKYMEDGTFFVLIYYEISYVNSL